MELASGQIRFRVHGPDTATDIVSGAVFAHQLGTLVRALKAADRSANRGKLVHDYVIANLNTSTPTAVLAEQPRSRFEGFFPGHSGIKAFEECVSAITVGEQDKALSYGKCVNHVAKFSPIGYSELWTEEEKVFRVDPFLSERAEAIVHPPISDTNDIQDGMASSRAWYKGTAIGSFDGEIKAADMRGALPQLKLLLTAGGSEIDCVCRAENIEEIRAALNRRARVYGRAIYDGRSGLPRRIEVDKIVGVGGRKDFSRWKGAFRPFETDAWEEEEV